MYENSTMKPSKPVKVSVVKKEQNRWGEYDQSTLYVVNIIMISKGFPFVRLINANKIFLRKKDELCNFC
jgi:hypothetical protein